MVDDSNMKYTEEAPVLEWEIHVFMCAHVSCLLFKIAFWIYESQKNCY